MIHPLEPGTKSLILVADRVLISPFNLIDSLDRTPMRRIFALAIDVVVVRVVSVGMRAS
jgi:hypothetical protein